MNYENLLTAVRRRPFEAFRIHLSDGTSFEVRHPDLVVVGRRSFFLGLRASEHAEPVYDRYEIIGLLHVVRLEPISEAAQAG